MRKLVFIFGMVLSFDALADVPSCGENCTYTLVQNNEDNDNPTYTLKVMPIDVSKPAQIKDYERNVYLNTPEMDDYEWHIGTNEAAPWYNNGIDSSITKIEVGTGIASVGMHAFSDMESVTEVKLPQGLEKIGKVALHAMPGVTSIDIPNSVTFIDQFGVGNSRLTEIGISEGLTKIGDSAFCGVKAENFVVPAGVTEISELAFTAGDGSEGRNWKTTGIKNLYCSKDLISQCQSALAYAVNPNDTDDINVIEYESKGGVYVIKDEYGNETYYVSANNMKDGQICEETLSECKKEALINRGTCSGSDCDALVAADDGGYLLKVGSKTYQNINALLRGDYDRRRIYTIEEANFVAGDKNRVSITYR